MKSKHHFHGTRLLLCLLFAGSAHAAIDNKLLEMTEQLDQLDRMDFQAALDAAGGCTRSRDFACAEKQLAKAGKLARGAKDKNSFQLAQQNLAAEKRTVEEERRRREEEERRLAEAEERLRIAQENAERQARMAEEDDGPSTASQLLQLGSLALRNYQTNRAATLAENAARSQAFNKMQAEVAAGLARDQKRFAEEKAKIEAARRERELQAAARANPAPRTVGSGNLPQYQLAQVAPSQTSSRGTSPSNASPYQAAQQDADDRRRREQLALQERQDQMKKQEDIRKQEELRKQDEMRKQEELRKQEEARKQEERRQRQAQEKADQLAKQQAEKEAEDRARRDYLSALLRGIQLKARKCPDGEGKYYVVGKRPRIKPEVVSCVDVHYRARCPGNVVGSDGVGKNFLGAGTDCFFGDAYTIDPKPPCPVNEVQVDVIEVRACGS